MILTALMLAAAVAAEPSPAAPSAPKSVRGTLQSVDKRLGAVSMKTDDGQGLSWRFSPAVLAEVAKAKTGAAMIVLYRQTAANEKRVTGVAFPGTAASPVYVNLTGERILVLSAASAADGTCGKVSPPFTEAAVPPGERAEVREGCWCCAPAGGACTPGTRSGQGTASLERCFE